MSNYSNNTTAAPATDKQIAFIATLYNRDPMAAAMAGLSNPADADNMTKREASDMIEGILFMQKNNKGNVRSRWS